MVFRKNKDIRILFLTYDGLTDPLGQSQVLPYLCGLSDKGISIAIISFEKKGRYKEGKKETKKICDSHSLQWIPLYYHKRPPVISTLFDILRLWLTARKFILKNDFHIIHCRSYIPSLAGSLLKKKHRVRFLFDMRGYWPDERIEGGLWNLNNPVYHLIYKYFKKKELDFIQNADHIISLTENARNEIISWESKIFESSKKYQTDPKFSEKITVIPSCADTKLFNPEKIDNSIQNNIVRSLGIDLKNHIFLYVGSLGTWYMLEEMLEFFQCFNRSNPNSVFIFLTSDNTILEEKLKKLNWTSIRRGSLNYDEITSGRVQSISSISYYADLRDTENQQADSYENHFIDTPVPKIIQTSAPRTLVPYMINLCFCSISFIKPSYSKNASSATKIGEVLSMGKPLIINPGWGDMDKLLKHSDFIWGINDFSQREYKRITDKILATPANESTSIRSYAIANLSLESGIMRYLKAYEKIMLST